MELEKNTVTEIARREQRQDVLHDDLIEQFDLNKGHDSVRSAERSSIELLKSRGFLLNEKWDKVFTIDAVVSDFDSVSFLVDCVLDREKGILGEKVFERKLLPKDLRIKIGLQLQIKVFEKSGSTRIDFLNGEGVIELDFFEKQERIDQIDELDLLDPADEDFFKRS